MFRQSQQGSRDKRIKPRFLSHWGRSRIFRMSALGVALCATVTANLLYPPDIYADQGEDSNVPHVDVIRHVPNEQKAIALTFDDGPSETFTPQVLKLLQKYHARATFFVIGSRIEKYPDLIRQELAMHNEIGNHSFSHKVLEQASVSRVDDELMQSQQAMMTVTGQEATHLFRPPRGRFGQGVLKAASEDQYKLVLWSLDTGDWHNPGAPSIVRHVLKDIKSGDILLFHDQGGNRTQTISALQGIIPELKRRGFQFVTVSELLHTASYPG